MKIRIIAIMESRCYSTVEYSLLQPNTRCYDVCMTHTLEHNTRMTWIKFFEFLAGRLHHVAIDYLESDRCRFTDNLHCVMYEDHWSAQPDVPSAARGASVACLSVCKTPFLLVPAEG